MAVADIAFDDIECRRDFACFFEDRCGFDLFAFDKGCVPQAHKHHMQSTGLKYDCFACWNGNAVFEMHHTRHAFAVEFVVMYLDAWKISLNSDQTVIGFAGVGNLHVTTTRHGSRWARKGFDICDLHRAFRPCG